MLSMEPHEALRLARAATVNARDYELQAKLLCDHGWHGRATSLAILGLEEAGKAIYLFLIAIGAVPVKNNWEEMIFRKHAPKQVIGLAPTIGEELLSWTGVFAVFEEVRDQLTDVKIADVDESMGEEIQSRARTLGLSIIARAEKERGFVHAMVERLVRSLKVVQDRSLDELKQRGLYVGPDVDGGVSAPQSIDRDSAEAQIARLARAVELATEQTQLAEADLDRARAIGVPIFEEARALGKKGRDKGSV